MLYGTKFDFLFRLFVFFLGGFFGDIHVKNIRAQRRREATKPFRLTIRTPYCYGFSPGASTPGHAGVVVSYVDALGFEGENLC